MAGHASTSLFCLPLSPRVSPGCSPIPHSILLTSVFAPNVLHIQASHDAASAPHSAWTETTWMALWHRNSSEVSEDVRKPLHNLIKPSCVSQNPREKTMGQWDTSVSSKEHVETWVEANRMEGNRERGWGIETALEANSLSWPSLTGSEQTKLVVGAGRI